MTDASYLYLWLNILSVVIPFLFSFYPKANFSNQWRFVFPAMVITAVFFILWDEWFTGMAVWGFNPKYLSGVYIFNLPLEEVLFFFCIPYACVFTHFALSRLVRKNYFGSHERHITVALVLLTFATGLSNLHRSYTGLVCVSTGVFLFSTLFWTKPSYMGRFYFSFLVLLIPFAIANGILTGSFIDEAVVWYDNTENLGIRLGTIPVEDAVYALLLILMNISIATWLESGGMSVRRRRMEISQSGGDKIQVDYSR
ncbi:MAG: lycopene cyclase domain-containing protein [Bacteroidota bacterium]|nr:lycopene cyclase domain-containing protein [Bacteroidota bacterium]